MERLRPRPEMESIIVKDRIRQLAAASVAEDFSKPSVTDWAALLVEWDALKLMIESGGHALEKSDLETFHSTGHEIFYRLRQHALALEQKILSVHFNDRNTQHERFRDTLSLLNYSAHYALDEAKTLEYLEVVLSAKLPKGTLRYLRREYLSSFFVPECQLKLPKAWLDRISKRMKKDESSELS